MNNLRSYKGIGFNSFLILGAAVTYISAVMPLIRETLSLSYTQVGSIFAAKALGFLLGAVISGFIVDRMGTKRPLWISFGILPLGLVLFALSPNALGLMLGNLLIGIGAAIVEVSIPPICRQFEGKSGKLLNLIHAFFALGAMIGPIIASVLIANQLPYMAFFFLMAGYTCVPLFFSTQLRLHIIKTPTLEKAVSRWGFLSIFKNKYFWLIVGAVFFYVGSEHGISSWSSSYAADFRRYDMELSSLLPSLFWVGLLIGRFISSVLIDRIGELKWLFILTASGLPFTFFAQLPFDSFIYLAVFTALSGLIHASIFPTLQSILVDTIRDHIGLALSCFSIAASAGSMFSSFIIGNISHRWGIQMGYVVPFGMFACLFIIIMLFFALWKKTVSDERKRG